MCKRLAFLALFLLMACTSSEAPRLSQLPARALEPSHGVEALGATAHFDFFAGEEESLHLFLFQWAKSESAPGSKPFESRAELASLTDEERQAWQGALDFYSREMIGRELLWDLGLIRLRDHLLGLWKLYPSDEANVAAVSQLRAVSSIYHRLFWPRHLAAARAWVKAYQALPSLAERELEMAARVGETFGGRWPKAPVRVDLAPYADVYGAFTTLGPHVTLSSLDPGYRGEGALEMVFHEGAHGDLTSEPLRLALAAEYKARGKRAHFLLTHAVHFYSVGELAKQAAARQGITYTPYDEAQGVMQRAWPKWREPLESQWLPYLQGKKERKAALADLVAAILLAEDKT